MEKAILVGLIDNNNKNLEELEGLAISANAKVVDKLIQKRKKIHPAYYIGKGKTKEVASISQKTNADVIIFNDDLSPAQHRNLEEIIKPK